MSEPHPRRPAVARPDRAVHRRGRAARGARRGPGHVLLRLRPDRAEPAHRQPRPAADRAPAAARRPPAARARRRRDRADRRPEADRRARAQRPGARRRRGWSGSARRSSRFLVFDGPTTPRVMVNNLDWTAPLSAIDFLRDIGKHFRVNKMLAKEAVGARLNSRGGHHLHRVQLPDPAGAGLPRAATGGTAARCRPAAATSGAT